MAMQQYVVRLAPITSQPIIVKADSLDAGRLSAVVDNKDTFIGIDYFRASEPADLEIAHKIVLEYAKRNNIPETEVMVRARLPKSNVIPHKPRAKQAQQRATNDANLKLVKDDNKPTAKAEDVQESSQDYRSKAEREEEDKLAKAVQAMQDAHTSVHGKKALEPAKASAEKPEVAVVRPKDATVKRSAEGKKPAKEAASKPAKRAYQRKPAAERSAKSKAAYERYIKELNQNASEQLPNFMEPVKAGPGVTAEEIDEATLAFAIKLAKLLKGVM